MEPELYNAAREGNYNLFEQRITNTGEEGDTWYEQYFGSITDEGDNILHLAARQSHKDFIEVAFDRLLCFVMLVCQVNNNGENPLHVAAEVGHLEIVKLLAEEGVAEKPWRARDRYGETPLIKALKGRHEQLAVYLFGEVPEVACFDSNVGESPLYLAASNGLEGFVEMVLTSGFDYSTKGPNEATPLHAAVHGCTDNTVELLLKNHPELIRKADSNKETALHLAVKGKKVDFTEMIIKADIPADEGTNYSAMITIYDAESIKERRDTGLSVQERAPAYQRDADGFTPLLRAAFMGLVNVVGVILRYSPRSIAICDSKGRTALHLMKLESYQDGALLFEFPVIQRLVNEPDIDGNTPLHLADFEVVASATPTEEIRERTPKIHERITPHKPSKEMQQSFNTLSATAAILAAVTFAAILAIPGSFDENGEPNLARNTLFKAFMLFNASAMCGYVLVLFCVLWAMMITQHGDEPRLLLTFGTLVLQLSFYATLTAFATAAYATISAKTLWLAIILVSLPACVVILTLPIFLLFRLPRVLSELCAQK